MGSFNSGKFNLIKFNIYNVDNVRETSCTVKGSSTLRAVPFLKDSKYCSANVIGESSLFARAMPTLSNIADGVRIVTSYVDVYFNGEDSIPYTFTYNYIDVLDILEELKADSRRLLGCSSSNELSFSFVNANREFSPINQDSTYAEKMKPGVAIKPYLVLADVAETVEYVFALGTFYSTDWADNSDSNIINTTGYDRLYTLYNKPFQGTRVMRDVSYYELYQALFDGTEGADNYIIDPALENMYTIIGWLPTGTFREAVDLLSEASNTFCYVNRDNQIIVSCINTSLPSKAYLDDTNQIMSSNIPTSYNNAYSELQITVTTPKVLSDYSDANEELVRISDYYIPSRTAPGDVYTIDKTAFLNGPVMKISSVLIYPADDSEYTFPTVSSYSNTATHITIDVDTAPFDMSMRVNIIVYGQRINMSSDTIKLESPEIKNIIGDKVYEVKNPLIQNRAHAEYIGQQVFPIMINPHSDINILARGNPIVQTGEVIEVDDITNRISAQRVLVYRNKISLAGGFSEEHVGYTIT